MAERSGQSVSCPACGKALRWRQEMVGRKMKCLCGQMFVMPANPGSLEASMPSVTSFAEEFSQTPDPPQPPQTPQPPASPFDHDTFELDFPPDLTSSFSSSSSSTAPVITGTCPSCRAPMKAGAVLCVHCGFHTVTGTKLNIGITTSTSSEDAPRRRSASQQAILDEEPNHRITEIYLPVAMIVVGIIVTIIRAYSGMGDMLAAQQTPTSPQFNSPFFQEPDSSFFDDMEEEMWDEEESDPQGTLDETSKTKQDEGTDDGQTKDSIDGKFIPPTEGDEADQTLDDPIETPGKSKNLKGPAQAPGQSHQPSWQSSGTSSNEFTVSPLIVAGFSVLFQVVVMVPVVFGCVLFVAKYVDVTFGSLSSVLLKITAVVLGPMAIADWVDDILISATMGMGAMLGWTIRLVLVGSSLIKLFDLDFFEAIVLMIVIALVRFVLAMFLVYALVSMFIS